MSEPYNGWSVLELLGHRRLHGLVQETTLAGAGMLRIDVYEGPAETPALTQFYPPSSVYCLTPTTEEAARKAAAPWTPPALAQPRDCTLCGDCCDKEMDDTVDCLHCGNPRGGCECD